MGWRRRWRWKLLHPHQSPGTMNRIAQWHRFEKAGSIWIIWVPLPRSATTIRPTGSTTGSGTACVDQVANITAHKVRSLVCGAQIGIAGKWEQNHQHDGPHSHPPLLKHIPFVGRKYTANQCFNFFSNLDCRMEIPQPDDN